jgi:hypothetical protein
VTLEANQYRGFIAAPYAGMDLRDVEALIWQPGHIIECPPNCPDEIFAIMLQCAHENPDQRPKFKEVAQQLNEIITCDNAVMKL